LLQSTRELFRVVLDYSIPPGKAKQQVARALGIVSQGRNGFATYRQLREDSFIATIYGLRPRKGETESWAVTLAEATGAKTNTKLESKVRSIKRRVAKVRRTLPRVT
jgi:hypothetical protein